MRGSPLIWAIGAGLVAMLALAPATGDALGGLRIARQERARLTAVTAGPPPARLIVAPGAGIAAPDRATAIAALAARLRTVAAKNGVLVEVLAPAGGAGLARVRLRVSGSEDAIITFADAIERGRPLVRFAAWSIAAEGSAIRLNAEIVAPWS